jgi:Holliday junction resolvase RusA-like endonuclease
MSEALNGTPGRNGFRRVICALRKQIERPDVTAARPVFECFTPGIPRPQGSKIRTRYGMRDASEYLEAWRATVAQAARLARIQSCREPLVMDELDGPLVLGVEFLFKRPGADTVRISGHFRKCTSVHMTAGLARECENCHGTYRMLRTDAPVYVTSTPDLDKLMRAVQDSLKTAKVYGDDRQVAGYAGFPLTCKRYANQGEEPGAMVRVWRVS